MFIWSDSNLTRCSVCGSQLTGLWVFYENEDDGVVQVRLGIAQMNRLYSTTTVMLSSSMHVLIVFHGTIWLFLPLPQKKLIKGNTAYIDDRWRTHSFITSKLVEVMEKCWAYKPEDRIDIFEAVRMLRAAKEEYLQQKQQGLENALEQEQLGKEGRSNDIDTKQNSG